MQNNNSGKAYTNSLVLSFIKARHDRNQTQEQVAATMGIPRHVLADAESMRIHPSANTCIKMIQYITSGTLSISHSTK
jgi:DNA-binding XRE family transcriptional regulator